MLHEIDVNNEKSDDEDDDVEIDFNIVAKKVLNHLIKKVLNHLIN